MKRQLEQLLEDCRKGDTNAAQSMLMLTLTPQMDSYRKTLAALFSGEPTVITKGKIPDAHIVFLDELFKAGDGILNALLTIINEKRYTNEGKTIDIPAISFFAASNELPNFENKDEQILAPLYDRFQLRVVTQEVQQHEQRLAMLKTKQTAQLNTLPSATITLEELYAMQREVQAIPVPDSINELMDDILCELRRKNIIVSDRKYFNYAPIAQAAAWLAAHDVVQPQDLYDLRNYLWNTPNEVEMVTTVLESLCANPLRTRVDELLANADQCYQAFSDLPDDQKKRGLVTFRMEIVQLYREWKALASNTPVEQDQTMLEDTLHQLEAFSQKAHQECSFTNVPLEQLDILQAAS